MKILITGNLGYVGSWVTRQLRSQFPGAHLVGLDTGYFAHCVTGALHAVETWLNVQHYADIRHIGPELLEGVDAVVHLAAVSNDPMGQAYEDVTFDVNCHAGVRLARYALAAGASSFVFASSCSVYGSADDHPRLEDDELDPLTAYAKSKVLAERALRDLASPAFRVTCLRFATACGMSDRLRLDLVLNDFVASAVSTGRITVLSDGSPWRPLIHVRDMARAIEWAVGRGRHEGGDFLIVNAGSDDWNYQIRELAESVARVISGTAVSINRAAPPDKRSYRVDFSRFRALAPRHQPQADLLETIADLRDGLASIGFADENVRNSSLVRLHVLADLQRHRLLNNRLEWVDKPSNVADRCAAAPARLSFS